MSNQTYPKTTRRAIAVAAAASLGLAAGTQVHAAPQGGGNAADAPLLLAGTVGMERRQDNREERRDDRGDRRDDRQDCRDVEGAVGVDKRDCKQDSRQERKSDGDDKG